MTTLEEINVEIGRLFLLDDAVRQSLPYRALIENVFQRKLPVLADPHMDHIRIVRSAALRSLMLATVAFIEPTDPRNNKASLGQILSRLNTIAKTSDLAKTFNDSSFIERLRDLINAHKACYQSDDYEHVREIRDNAIAHILDGIEDIPKVDYEAVFRLHDAAKLLVRRAFEITGRPIPTFLGFEKHATLSAESFWDTYLCGALGGY